MNRWSISKHAERRYRDCIAAKNGGKSLAALAKQAVRLPWRTEHGDAQYALPGGGVAVVSRLEWIVVTVLDRARLPEARPRKAAQ